ncbi:MAG: RMD1 family protein, partial [Vallitaleaceae bacterium]|nr:RMD1 family protein [Vallitaleaceae bacterium]
MLTKFKAIAVADEIDLNKLAIKCNVPKKYTWEEPLTLQGDALSLILGRTMNEDQKVSIFAFGSIVFINSAEGDIEKFVNYLMTIEKRIDLKSMNKYSDTYDLITDSKIEEITITDDFVYVNEYAPYYPDLISMVIAKSVGLEKIEEKIKVILDSIEEKIIRFESGKLRVSDKELAKTISRILRHEYNSIAYIMILDKPDVTWIHTDAAIFYEKMSEFFELNDRYEIFKTKTNILNDIVNGFSMISHSMKGMFVEWTIVILIIIEVVLMT